MIREVKVQGMVHFMGKRNWPSKGIILTEEEGQFIPEGRGIDLVEVMDFKREIDWKYGFFF